MNQCSVVLIVEGEKITEMTPEGILRELLFLQSSAAQEKDPRYGVSMGLTEKRQVRLDELTQYILSSLTTEAECRENNVTF